MKKGISCLLLAMILSSCGGNPPQGGEDPFKPNPGDDPILPDPGQGEEDDIKVASINLKNSDDANLVLGINKTYKLEYVVLPSNATNKGVTWSTSDISICSIYSETTGIIRAKGVGEATITIASKENPSIKAECHVSVEKVSVQQLNVSTSSITLKEGESSTFQVSIVPNDATNKVIGVESFDSTIATVSKESGLTYKVEGLKEGQTTIKVTSYDNESLVQNISVNVEGIPLTGVSFTNDKIYLNVDSTQNLITKFTPSNASNKDVTYSSDDPTIASINENGEVLGINVGETYVRVTSNEGSYVGTCKVIVSEAGVKTKSSLSYTQNDLYSDNYSGRNKCAPSKGTVNVLVIPIWFTDSPSYISLSTKERVRVDIEKTFKGTNEQTGWRSVKTYYEEESNGELTLNPVVTPWFECNMSSSTFAGEVEGLNQTTSFVNTAVANYKKTNKISSLSNFDQDADGYIDAVIMIYGCPDYIAWDRLTTGYSNLWAYCFWNTSNVGNVQDPVVNNFMWASYDFMYDSEMAYERTGNKSNFGGGDTSNCNLDAHTYIHEFGHILGLNDYYDYSKANTPSGGFSMQDQNVGGHDPYSVLKWGWADPYVVTDTETVTIKDFQSSKDVILVQNEYSSSPFDEYILIELYTPTGLNEFDTKHHYFEDDFYPQGVDKTGIRMWHVDGRLLYANRSGLDYYFNKNNWTTNPFTEEGNVREMMANSFNVPARETLNELHEYSELFLIRNNKDVTYMPSASDWKFDESSMFYLNDYFDINTYSNQFKNKKKGALGALLNNDQEFDFRIKVESLSSSEATISITKY